MIKWMLQAFAANAFWIVPATIFTIMAIAAIIALHRMMRRTIERQHATILQRDEEIKMLHAGVKALMERQEGILLKNLSDYLAAMKAHEVAGQSQAVAMNRQADAMGQLAESIRAGGVKLRKFIHEEFDTIRQK